MRALLLTLICLVCGPALAASAAVEPRMAQQIIGVEDALARTVLAEVPSTTRCSDPAWIARYQLQRLGQALRLRLRAQARYGPIVERRLERDPATDCWRGELRVDPGAQTRIRNAEVDVQGPGSSLPAIVRLLAARPLRPDTVLDEAAYTDLKDTLVRLAREQGYFDTVFTEARIDVYPQEASADITLLQDTGQRYRIGELDLSLDDERLARSAVERFITLQPGEPYSIDDVQQTRRALINTGVFRIVDVVADSAAREAGAVPMRVGLETRARHYLSSGVGYATDFGPRASMNYENRFVNDALHQFSGHLFASPLLQEISGDYRLPIMPSGDPWLSINGRWKQERTASFSNRAWIVGLRHLRDGPLGFRLTQYASVRFDDFAIGGERRNALLVEPQVQFHRASQLQPGPLETGWSAELTVRGAAQPLSTTNFVQAILALESARRLGERYRLVGRTRLGTTVAEAIDELPPDRRFFIGGDVSVRGFDYQAEGPRDSDGFVIGGRHLAEFSVELERLMSDRWSLAAFVDTGSAFDEAIEQWYTGVGVGVRLHTPIGPIRLDVAAPLDEDAGVRLHLGVGQRFR